MRIETAHNGPDAPPCSARGSRRDAKEAARAHLGGERVGHTHGSGLRPEALVRLPVARATGRVLALAASIAALVLAGGAAIRPF